MFNTNEERFLKETHTLFSSDNGKRVLEYLLARGFQVGLGSGCPSPKKPDDPPEDEDTGEDEADGEGEEGEEEEEPEMIEPPPHHVMRVRAWVRGGPPRSASTTGGPASGTSSSPPAGSGTMTWPTYSETFCGHSMA